MVAVMYPFMGNESAEDKFTFTLRGQFISISDRSVGTILLYDFNTLSPSINALAMEVDPLW